MLDNTFLTQDTKLDIGISHKEMHELQKKDDLCKHIFNLLNKNQFQSGHAYFVRDNILMQYVMDDKHAFETIVLPQSFPSHVFNLAHN